jgi:tetratricopeptide (TPR) repeat protein
MRINSRFVIASSCVLASVAGLASPLYAAPDKTTTDTAKNENSPAAVKTEAAVTAKQAPAAVKEQAVAPAKSDAKSFNSGVKPPMAQKIPQHFQEGLVYQSMGVLEQAIANYKRALKDDPTYVSTYNNLAQCYVDRGGRSDREEAKRLVGEALKISPENVGSLHANALIACQEEKFEDAVKAYKKILAIQPLNFRAVQNLSELYYYKLDQPAKAKQLLKATLKQNPPDQEKKVFAEALQNLDDLVKHKHKNKKVASKASKAAQ